MAELLSPAGNLQKMGYALHYGADAVYVGGPEFSLRTRAENFSYQQLEEGIALAHAQGKKLYLAVNSYFRENMLTQLSEFLARVVPMGPDALIMCDLGAINLTRRLYPEQTIHVSTQANTTNSEAVRFYQDIGVKRVILARELSLDNIKQMRDNLPDMELEVFVHGAMCVAYSGRCLISNYLTSRGFLSDGEEFDGSVTHPRIGNEGDCSHTCRWHYSLVEEKRDGVALLAEEVEGGTMLFASKDLCMVHHMGELIEAGIDSFKIEGRMKSLQYVANTARIYRYAIDMASQGNSFSSEEAQFLQQELDSVTRRPCSTGFFFPENRSALWPSGHGSHKGNRFQAVVIGREQDLVRCRSYNKVSNSDSLVVVGPNMKRIEDFSFELLDEKKNQVEYVGHSSDFYLRTSVDLAEMDILRLENYSDAGV